MLYEIYLFAAIANVAGNNAPCNVINGGSHVRNKLEEI
jgi:hypothetical protein